MPIGYVWLEFEFYLHSGYFSLSKNKSGSIDELETIRFIYEDLMINSNLRVVGNDISLSIQNLSLLYEENNFCVTLLNKFNRNKDHLIFINYSSKPPNSDAIAKLSLESQTVEINFDSKAINSLICFFLVLNAQETVKIAAWDKFQEIQDTTQETLTDLFYKQNRFEISIHACGPLIKLPSQYGCFYLELGRFSVNNKDSNDDNYEGFEINLSSLELKYQQNEDSIVIIPGFEICFSMMYLKSKIRENK